MTFFLSLTQDLFYLGHIPCFLDIFLSKFLNEKHTEPEYFKDIFERGIDPNVDDPTQIHVSREFSSSSPRASPVVDQISISFLAASFRHS